MSQEEGVPHFNAVIDPAYIKSSARQSGAVVLAAEGPPRRSRVSPKLSQSSDEIAHTTNAFYER